MTSRLSALFPRLTEMQVHAIAVAAVSVSKEGLAVYPEICFSKLCSTQEEHRMISLVQRAAEEVIK